MKIYDHLWTIYLVDLGTFGMGRMFLVALLTGALLSLYLVYSHISFKISLLSAAWLASGISQSGTGSEPSYTIYP
jgi:hypothetical protein